MVRLSVKREDARAVVFLTIKVFKTVNGGVKGMYILRKMSPLISTHKPRNLGMSGVVLNMIVRRGVTFCRVRQSPARSGRK